MYSNFLLKAIVKYFEFTLFVSCLYYFITLLWFIKGTFISKNIIKKPTNPGVSVIVSIRNGDKALPQIIKNLENQTYSGNLEFLLVDDDSTDKTAQIIQKKEKEDNRFKYIHSKKGNPKLTFKKRGIDAGICSSKYDVLLFTDVDCNLLPTWVQGMNDFFNDDIDYIIGYSETRSTQKFVSKFQKIDFLMLMSSARSSAVLGHPWASSGQNQGYKKSIYLESGGFSDIANQLQGDDSLFLNMCYNKLNIKTTFADNSTTFVTSRPERTWRSFLKQRIRWAGDANIMWKFNKIFFISICATFVANLLLLIGVFISFSNLVLTCLFLKFSLEFILYFMGSKQFNSKINFIYFVAWFVIQIPYIIAMGLLSTISKYLSWRGRKVTVR